MQLQNVLETLQDIYLFFIYCLLKFCTILCETSTIWDNLSVNNSQNERPSTERETGHYKLNDGFFSNSIRTPKFQKLEIGSDLTFMQSKIKIWGQTFCKQRKCEIKICLTNFLNILALKVIHIHKLTVKISS